MYAAAPHTHEAIVQKRRHLVTPQAIRVDGRTRCLPRYGMIVTHTVNASGHRHLHILLNRVHPDTGRAWKTSQDFARFDRIMRQLSEDYGFEYAPAHVYNPEQTDEHPKKPNSQATYAAKHGAKTQRLQWSKAGARKLGETLNEDLTPASTWEDVEMALADRGLTLERKGKGFVTGNAVSYAKLSSLGLQITAKGAPHYPPNTIGKRASRHFFDVDEIDIVRALMTVGMTDRHDLLKAIREKASERMRRLGIKEQIQADIGRTLASTALTKVSARNRRQRQLEGSRERSAQRR